MQNKITIPLYLAPMDNISDYPFRLICKKNGADFVYTEFISAESIIRGSLKSLQKMHLHSDEKPCGIQIFGHNIASMCQAAIIAQQYNPEEININCGCPIKKIVNKGAGAALLQDIPHLLKMIKEIVNAVEIPVTVKTRLGWDEKNICIEDLVLRLQDIGVKKVIIHARTKKQMYSGIVQTQYLKKVKQNKNITIPIIGNGDVKTIEDAYNMQQTGVDGIMIGRGAIGNPWIFNNIKQKDDINNKTIHDIVKCIQYHISLAIKHYNVSTALISLKKHYSGYFKNIPNSKFIRLKLMNCNNIDEITSILSSLLSDSNQ